MGLPLLLSKAVELLESRIGAPDSLQYQGRFGCSCPTLCRS